VALSTITAFTQIAERSEATPGLFNRPLQQLYDNISSINSVADFGVVNVKQAPYLAAGDGTTDDTAAVQAALNAAATRGSCNLYFPPGTYRISSLSIPSNIGRGVSWEGAGAGAAQKSTLRFTGNGGLNFGNSGEPVRMSRLVLSHISSGSALSSSNGTGLYLGSGSYHNLEDVWIEYFNVNIQLAGYNFYARMDGVRSVYALNANLLLSQGGAEGTYALINGNWFANCQFSSCSQGSGVSVLDAAGSAAIAFRSCKFEGNKQHAFATHATGYINLKFDTCYFEANGATDVVVSNDYPTARSLVHFDTCYFDPNNILGGDRSRIQLKGVRAIVENSAFYSLQSTSTLEPILVADVRGTQPSVAYNNDYQTMRLVRGGAEAGWIITDSKHPTVSNSTDINNGNFTNHHALKPGTFVLNANESTNSQILGWTVETGGMWLSDQLSGVTASTETSRSTLVPNNTQYPLVPGDHVQVAGVTWNRTAVGGSSADTWAVVRTISAEPLVWVDGSANSRLDSAVLSYRTASIATVYKQQSGTWTPTDGSGAGLSYATAVGAWIRHGEDMKVWGVVRWPSTSNGASAIIGGLPITPKNVGANESGAVVFTSHTSTVHARTLPNDTKVYLYAAGSNITNGGMSEHTISFTANYRV
jgi:hypothetical protein